MKCEASAKMTSWPIFLELFAQFGNLVRTLFELYMPNF